MKKGLVFLISFLLVITSVNAFELLSNDQTTSLCPRDTHLFIDLVRNDGQKEQSFDVRFAGKAAAWTSSIPIGFILAPGQERAIYTYLTPTSNTFPAKYNLDVIVGNGSTSKTAHHSIIVKDCLIKSNPVNNNYKSTTVKNNPVVTNYKTSIYDYKLTIERNYIEMCDQSKQVIPLEIYNKGSQDSYDIKIDGPLWASLDNQRLTLNPKSTRRVNLILTPDYSVEGSFDIKVNVIPDNSNTKAIAHVNVNVKECNSVYLNILGSKDEICNSQINKYKVVVKNNGTITHDFGIELDGPEWAEIDYNKPFTLKPGIEKVFILSINPKINSDTDDQNIYVRAFSMDEPEINSEDSIKIKNILLEDCNGLSNTTLWKKTTDFVNNIFKEKQSAESTQDSADEVQLNVSETNNNKITGMAIKDDIYPVLIKIDNYKMYIFFGLLIILLIIIFVRYDFHKKVGSFFEEENDR